MKKFFSLLALMICTFLSAQNADFETVSFEIRPIAMNTAEKSLLTYDLDKDAIPSKFTIESLSQSSYSVRDNSPLIYRTQERFANKNVSPTFSNLEAPTLNAKQVYAFGNDEGASKRVKNIAYKRASGGNIADAYCNALYAARSEGRQ